MTQNNVPVVKLDFEGQVCIYGDIDAAIEEVRLFWTEDGPEMGITLTLTFDEMPKDEFDNLPEFAGW
jgi:hypothetical protein